VELFDGVSGVESRKFNGTTDVAIVESCNVDNDAIRNTIETLLEVKSPQNIRKNDYCPQTAYKHFAVAYLNPNHAVVSVLTDLDQSWTFFWFATREDDPVMALNKHVLKGEGAASEAKYLLESIYDSTVGDTLPSTFSKRQPLRAVLESIKRRRAQMDFYDDGNPPTKRAKSSRVDNCPDSNALTTGSSSTTGDGDDDGTPMSMANALSLFASPTDREVASELDLLDMVGPDEQYEIVKSFTMKHIVPYMRG